MKYIKSAGFTLIELLIVIVILGLLASLVAPEMLGKIDSSGRKTALTQMKMLDTALNTYRLDVGSYPKSLEGLVKSDSPKWEGPYLPKSIPLDPWGNAYVYSLENTDGKPFVLMSLGRDGKLGGDDADQDIVLQ